MKPKPALTEEQREEVLLREQEEREQAGTLAYQSTQAYCDAAKAVQEVAHAVGVTNTAIDIMLLKLSRRRAAAEAELLRLGSFATAHAAAGVCGFLGRVLPLEEGKPQHG